MQRRPIPSPRQAPSREERALWRAAVRGVAPLAGGTPLPAEAEKPAPAEARPAPLPPPRAARSAVSPAPPPGLDRRSAQRLRRGQIGIEARLDLHGMTQEEAHGAVEAFLARAASAGRRCVLVITGRSGVLKSAVPRWLEEGHNRRRLLAVAPAVPRDGGAGALYLLLRRQR